MHEVSKPTLSSIVTDRLVVGVGACVFVCMCMGWDGCWGVGVCPGPINIGIGDREFPSFI